MSEPQQAARSFPWAAATCCVSALAGTGLLVSGIYELAGLGWALVAGSVPFLLLTAVILRGLR